MATTCKSRCARMDSLERALSKYEKLQRAFNLACAELSLGTHYYSGMTMLEVKDELMKDK